MPSQFSGSSGLCGIPNLPKWKQRLKPGRNIRVLPSGIEILILAGLEFVYVLAIPFGVFYFPVF